MLSSFVSNCITWKITAVVTVLYNNAHSMTNTSAFCKADTIIIQSQDMPQAVSFQLLAAKAWFNYRAIQVRLLGNKVPLGQVFLQALQFSHQTSFHQHSIFVFIHLVLMPQSLDTAATI